VLREPGHRADRVVDAHAVVSGVLEDGVQHRPGGAARPGAVLALARGNEIALNTFINGVSFWENPHSVFSSGINPGIVQSLNVMTGSFPAEYGNRFGGVIDVVTKSGFSMNNEGTLSIEAGNGLRHSAAIEYGGHRGKTAYYFQSSGFESARFLSPNDVRSIHDTGRGSHNFLQVDFNATPKDFVKFIVMADGTNFQIPKTSLDDEVRPNANASERTRGVSPRNKEEGQRSCP